MPYIYTAIGLWSESLVVVGLSSIVRSILISTLEIEQDE